MNKTEKDKPAMQTAILTIIVILSCVAVYLFTETGYKQEKSASVQQDAQTEYVESGFLDQNTFEKKALFDQNYRIDEEGVYRIEREELPQVYLRAALDGDEVIGFLLIAELPKEPEEELNIPQSGILEQRLYETQKAYYLEQTNWLAEKLPDMIGALDTLKRLSTSDIDYMLTYIKAAIKTAKRQELKLDGVLLRAYCEASADMDMLHISLELQDAYYEA